MSEWTIVLLVCSSVLLVIGLVHGILRYRRLMREEATQGEAVMALSLAVWRQARRIVVFLVGMTVMLFGVVLFFLPGPGTVVVPIGLAILAVEFTWARRWLRRLRVTLHLSAKRSRRFWRRKKEREAKSPVN